MPAHMSEQIADVDTSSKAKFRSGVTMRHLLYVDDFKLYVRNEGDIDSLICLIRLNNENIAISFRLDKCECLVANKGNDDQN